jgi:hypothetical protein
LNSPPPLLSIPLPSFLQQFRQVSFLHLHTCVYIICTILTLLHLSLPPLPPTGANPPRHPTLAEPIPPSYSPIL